MKSRKSILLLLAGLLCSALITTAAVRAQVYVKGYHRSDGTYVEGHYRSTPNKSKADNYSYKGNRNPYTGEKGSQTYGCYPFCD